MFASVCSDWIRIAEDGGWWDRIGTFLREHRTLLVWLGVLSLASGVVTILLLPVVVVRLPADYFVASRHDLADRRRPLLWMEHALRNVVGIVFVLAGIAMLVLPGQGLLTILIGLLLVDFPGKRAIELRLVRQPKLLAFLNRLRERRGRPPLQVD